MHKILYSIIIILIFSVFTLLEIGKMNSYNVIGMDNALEIKVSSQKNKVENICIDAEAFSIDFKKDNKYLAKRYGITAVDSLKMGYLTDTFAENLILDKKVKLKYTGKYNQNCRYADIIVNNESYIERMYNSGLFIINGKHSENFKLKLDSARKLNLVILNHKSNKYHKLNCEYGLSAEDVIIVPEKQLPIDSKPCQYCHIKPKEKIINEISFPNVISEGNIKIYLTDLTKKLKPDDKCSESLVCTKLLELINNSSDSIDIAMYGWSNVHELYNALLNAKNRGVKLRVVYDNSTSKYYEDTDLIVDIADISTGDNNKSLMHNKFMIFDNKSVITGSMNFSKTGLSGFNTNSIIFVDSVELAKIYTDEFEKMLKGNFSIFKISSVNKNIVLNKTELLPLFSPNSKTVTKHIIPLINNSYKYIYVPAFVITHEAFANSLINAKQRGIDVKIILDSTSTSASNNKIKILRESGIPLKIENYAGKIHSKSVIIDDKYIITGSMNFSNSGENKNDENTLIIKDERLAIYYRRFFEYLWDKIPDKYLKFNPRPESKDSIGSCYDGVDNDYDGKIDSEDDSCN